jgi:sec-independent protein translocase protein TatA
MHPLVLLFFSNLFSTDMVLIVIVALVLFGGDKLPEIVRGLGKGIRDFKEASEGVKREINAQIYSYEEKKAVETAAVQYEAEQNNPAATEMRPPVANTVPINESGPVENSIGDEHKEVANAENVEVETQKTEVETEKLNEPQPVEPQLVRPFENKDRPVV